MNIDQFQHLIEAVRVAATLGDNPDATPDASHLTLQPKNSFANCRFTFNGKCDTRYVVEEFITSIELYKKVEQISDKDALRGISLMFYDLASTWWQGIKKEATTWNDAIQLIRNQFSPTKPSYQIYKEIFETSQDAGTDIDTFVCQKRALLAQLPQGRHTEEIEIDLIYGLLHVNYSKQIARQDVKTFRDLLERGRVIEDTMNEFADPCAKCHFSGHTIKNCRKIYSDENDNDIFVIYT